jgi:hypothetical protein
VQSGSVGEYAGHGMDIGHSSFTVHVEWVPVTTAWRILELQMEDTASRKKIPANMLNKQSRNVDKVRPADWKFVMGLTTPHREKPTYEMLHINGGEFLD